MKRVATVVCVVLFFAGCPEGESIDHPIVGDWVLRWQAAGEWLPYLHFSFTPYGTCEYERLDGANIPGTFTVINARSVQAVFPNAFIGISMQLDITVSNDSLSGTYQAVGIPNTTSPISGFRETKLLRNVVPVPQTYEEQMQILPLLPEDALSGSLED